MNVEQTAVFIWTLGHDMQWPEAEKYSKNFKDNQISGDSLQYITAKMLKDDLGVINPEHLNVILSKIKSLFPLFSSQGKQVDLTSSQSDITFDDCQP